MIKVLKEKRRNGKLLPGSVVEYHSDSATAISYVNAQGGKIEELDDLTRELWQIALQEKCWLQARFLPGRFQVAADPMSLRPCSADFGQLAETRV